MTQPMSALNAPIAFYGRWWMLILLFGLSIRLCLAPCPGFVQDYIYLSDWVRYMDTYGVGGLYHMDPVEEQVLNYPPVYLYVLAAQEFVYRNVLPQVEPGGRWHMALYKAPPIAADLALAMLVMAIVRRREGERPALVAGAAVSLNPGAWYLSGYWGMVDSVFVLPLLLALWMAAQRRVQWAAFFLVLAVFTKLQSVLFVPLVFLAVLRHPRPVELVRFGVVLILTALALLAPLLYAGTAGIMFRRVFIENLAFFPHISFYGANLWGLHPQPMTFDWHAPALFYDAEMKTGAGNPLIHWLTYKHLGLLMFGAVFAMAHLRYWLRPGPNDIFQAAATVGVAFFLLPTEVHERYLFPAIIFLAILMPRHPALRWVFAALSITFLLNLALALPVEAMFYPLSLFQVVLGLLAVWFATRGAVWMPADWIASLTRYRGACLAALLLPVMLWAPYVRPDHAHRYLSDLTPIASEQGWGPLMNDANLDKRPIRLGPYQFRKGVCVHAASRVVYAVPPHSDAFEAWIGLDRAILANPEAETVASATFAVEVDGRVVYESDVFRAQSPPLRLRIPVRGATWMVLHTGDANDGNRLDHTCWATARFVRDPNWEARVEVRPLEP